MIGRTNTGGGGGGKTEEEKEIVLDLALGDQVVYPTAGSVFSKVTIKKPADLASENIKSGKTIGGVPGSLVVSSTTPTLYAPSISKSGNTLYISNSSNNGAFVGGYRLYSGGNLVATQSSTSLTLTSLAKGQYSLTAKAYGTGFNDSNASNSVAATVYEFLKNIKGVTISATLSKTTDGNTVSFTLAAASGYHLPTAISVHCNGEALSYTYSPYTGAVNISSLKSSYSGSSTFAGISPTISISGNTLSVSDIALASEIDVYDGSTLVAEETVTPTVSDTADVIIIDAEGLATAKLVAPKITLSGATLSVVDSVNNSGDVVNATSYDVYDGSTLAGNITIN